MLGGAGGRDIVEVAVENDGVGVVGGVDGDAGVLIDIFERLAA